MDITIGSNAALIAKAQSIRHQIFTIEQGIPRELDTDGLDETAYHALVTDGPTPIATARLAVDTTGLAVIARVGVLKAYRGLGIASKMIEALMAHAHQLEASAIELHAHEYLKDYYAKFGFEFIRYAEVVGGHPLIIMRHEIAPPKAR
ncbi:GNAT family N-acetyltransferase [Celerinatantimonas sp. YJH-8]|uniref:GNAT family N-acetyltransferase n=1 Tax=Celerinatantimonas sp. YJH-8 TaxID=3228714 RepID=UPI0038CB8448